MRSRLSVAALVTSFVTALALAGAHGRRSRLVALLLAGVIASACGSSSGSPTTPTTPTSQKTTFLIVFGPDAADAATYSATFQGQTFTASGGFQLSLAPGTYDISGSFTGGVFVIGFGALTSGGAQSGSIKAIAGPSGATVASCSIGYFNSTTPNQSRAFTVEFTVTTNVGATCQ